MISSITGPQAVYRWTFNSMNTITDVLSTQPKIFRTFRDDTFQHYITVCYLHRPINWHGGKLTTHIPTSALGAATSALGVQEFEYECLRR